MSSTPQPSSTTRPTSAYAGPLQAVLAALAVCVLYWAVGINETPAAASGTTSNGVHLQHDSNATTLGSTVSKGHATAGQMR